MLHILRLSRIVGAQAERLLGFWGQQGFWALGLGLNGLGFCKSRQAWGLLGCFFKGQKWV